MSFQDYRFDLTTDASGDVTVTQTRKIVGKLYAVMLNIGTLAATADVTVSSLSQTGGVDQTLVTLTNASADVWHYVRVQEKDDTGAGTGTYDEPVVYGKLSVTVAQGGNAKTATLIAITDE